VYDRAGHQTFTLRKLQRAQADDRRSHRPYAGLTPVYHRTAWPYTRARRGPGIAREFVALVRPSGSGKTTLQPDRQAGFSTARHLGRRRGDGCQGAAVVAAAQDRLRVRSTTWCRCSALENVGVMLLQGVPEAPRRPFTGPP
jgi:hypothetical protein